MKSSWQGAKLFPFLLVVSIATILWFLPSPQGLSTTAWHLLIIFLGTIIMVILKPLPIGAIVILSIMVCTVTHTLSIKSSLQAFSSPIVWLILVAFFLARGFVKTGLGSRVAYFFISFLGKSTIGLAYGCILTELILAPFIPSNTARGAGIVFPIITSLINEMSSNYDERTSRRFGAYLIKVGFHINMITSAMFMTGLVGNPLIAMFAKNAAGVTITWNSWALAAVIPGIVNLIVLPLALYKIHPPLLKSAPEAVQLAKEKLKKMGRLQKDEWIMIGTFVLILTLWMMGKTLNIDATVAGLIGFSILLFTGVLTWKEVTEEKNAWDTMLWFAPFLMMADELTRLGTMQWFSGHMQGFVAELSWPLALLLLGLVYFYIHYIFASVTAHITALYSAFLVVLISLHTPPMLAAMMLAVGTSLSGSLTHFGTGTAPVYFGAGYVSIKEWWRISFLISIVNILVWGITAGVWWKILGYW